MYRPSTLSFLVSLVCLCLGLLSPTSHADEWESNVNGQAAYDKVQAMLEYKQAQAEELEAIFSGLRDKLYVVSPTSTVAYDSNSMTPKTLDYTVDVTAKYNSQERDALLSSLQKAKHLKKGQHSVTIKFAKGAVKIWIYRENKPTFDGLTRNGYGFEARAVLMDNEQTVIAASDNSLRLSTPKLSGGGLDFSGRPLLQTYEEAKKPDLTGAKKELNEYFEQPVYRLKRGSQVHFRSLKVEELKRVVACRVLRDSDELLVYKRDKK